MGGRINTMRITIDTKTLRRMNIPTGEFLYLLSLYCRGEPITKNTPIKIWDNGYSIQTINGYNISRDGIRLVQDILMHAENKKLKDNSYYEEMASAMQGIYPEGLKPATHSMWRGSMEENVHRLTLLEYVIGHSIDKAGALKATQEYVDSFKDGRQYMRTLPYFIIKYDRANPQNIEWTSELLNIMENTDNKPIKN